MSRQLCVLPFAALLALSGFSTADDEPALEAPRGGWNVSGLVDASDEKAVAYPFTPIDRGAQRGRTLIRGHLQEAGRDRAHTLVVNGNAMPLYLGEGGRYARPYVFGGGSNSIEVKSADGSARRRVQFYEASANRTQARIRIILGWDDDQAEVDLHVLTPDGQHAFFANPILTNGGGMDVDSVDGAGPEMFSMPAPMHGAYEVYVNYWGNFSGEGYHFDEKTRKKDVITTTVTVVFEENTLREKRETFLVPLRKIGELTHVKTFLY